jgi:hypothetical protein
MDIKIGGFWHKMGRGFIYLGAIYFIWLAFQPSSFDMSSVLESSALKNIKKDPETQEIRKDFIDDLISQDIFKKINTLGTLPHIYVGDIFYNLPFKDKEKFVNVVLAYGYTQSKETTIVLIYDNKINKKVGSYNAVNGLDLNL